MKPDYIMANGSTIRLMEDAIENERRFQAIFTPDGLRDLFAQPRLQARPPIPKRPK